MPLHMSVFTSRLQNGQPVFFAESSTFFKLYPWVWKGAFPKAWMSNLLHEEQSLAPGSVVYMEKKSLEGLAPGSVGSVA